MTTIDRDAVLGLIENHPRALRDSEGGDDHSVACLMVLQDLHKQIRALPTNDEVAGLRAENRTLRKALATSGADCPYCGLPAADLAKCESGFPGCGRTDDIVETAPLSSLPWKKEYDEDTGHTRIYAADGSLVTDVGYYDQPLEQQEANADLIVSASRAALHKEQDK